jgi:hypothetical protein
MRGDICDSLERKFGKREELINEIKEQGYGKEIERPEELIR